MFSNTDELSNQNLKSILFIDDLVTLNSTSHLSAIMLQELPPNAIGLFPRTYYLNFCVGMRGNQIYEAKYLLYIIHLVCKHNFIIWP